MVHCAHTRVGRVCDGAEPPLVLGAVSRPGYDPPMSEPVGQFVAKPRDVAPPPLPEVEEVNRVAKETADRVAAAQTRKRQFVGAINGAKLRVGILEAELIEAADGDAAGLSLAAMTAKLGLATADWAMIQVLNGTVEIKDAKQALDVAKVALDIHDRMAGETPEDLATLTPEQRDARHKALKASIASLTLTLRRREAEAGDQLPDPNAPPPSPVGPVGLATVPTQPPPV